MKLNFVIKLCNMISDSFKVITSYYDSDGQLNFMSNSLDKDYMNYYLYQTKYIVQRCLEEKEIQVNINEVAITWIAIPVISGDIIRGSLVIGPFSSVRLSDMVLNNEIEKMGSSDAEKIIYKKYRNSLPYYCFNDYIKMISLVSNYLYDKSVDISKICITSKEVFKMIEDADDETANGIPETEEHVNYNFERYIWECIRVGDVDKLKKYMSGDIPRKTGRLSTGSELRHLKNLCIIGISLAARAAMEGGLNSDIAYSLSDIYIRQIESMNTVPENIHNAIFDYASRVKELSKINYSPHVNKCCQYIHAHSNENILVGHLAEHLGISSSHISRIFKNDTGLSIQDYIKKVKVKEAKFLLKFTDLSLVEISVKLSFSSQSHFNNVFKEEMSITPKQYRDKVKVPTNI